MHTRTHTHFEGLYRAYTRIPKSGTQILEQVCVVDCRRRGGVTRRYKEKSGEAGRAKPAKTAHAQAPHQSNCVNTATPQLHTNRTVPPATDTHTQLQTATDYHTNTASQKGCRINRFEIDSGLCMVSLAASLSHMMQPAVIMRSGCLRVSLPVAENHMHCIHGTGFCTAGQGHRSVFSEPLQQLVVRVRLCSAEAGGAHGGLARA